MATVLRCWARAGVLAVGVVLDVLVLGALVATRNPGFLPHVVG